ncbi:uncharacterized protein BKA78DRAFT_171934 [Phyllosticta capitalensis]|uniref:uncharacterized protein n=1 Tax=Phyllosticta capitalensis TaxID=121624 RepID=UPI003131E3D2
MSPSNSPPADPVALEEARRQEERVREARVNALRVLLDQEAEIAGAIEREEWRRATTLALAALRNPTLPLFFRGVYEAYLATFPGREQHTRGHYDRCRQAMERLQAMADADPDAEERGAYDRVRQLRGCLERIEELERDEGELRAQLRARARAQWQ